MTPKKSTYLFILCCLLNFCAIFAQEQVEYGLYFSSHEVIQDKRTSLNLTPDKPYNISKGLVLDFDAYFRTGSGHFGNIFRILADSHLNIDFVTNSSPTSKDNFWLVVKDSIVFSYKWPEIPNGKKNQWMDIRFEVLPESGLIALSINGNRKTHTSPLIKDIKKSEIVFGKSNLPKFLMTDVSPMSIKDIELYNAKGKLLCNWHLKKHTNTQFVYDEIDDKPAIAQNAVWLIDKHVSWKKENAFTIDNLIGITENPENGMLFLVNDQNVYRYSLQSNSIDTIAYSGNPFPCTNTLVFNQDQNQLQSYSFGNAEVSSFDFEQSTWSLNETSCNPQTHKFHSQHNKIFSSNHESIFVFGGYGQFTYKGTLRQLPLNGEAWQNKELSNDIAPRYISSMGELDQNHVLIFGGYGSKSGRQEVHTEHFYDLFRVNLTNYKVDKLWEVSPSAENPFVPFGSMVISEESRNFFTLIYDNSNFNTFLKLAKFRIEDGKVEVFPDSIPYPFRDIHSYGSLFLDKKSNKLITVTQYNGNVNLYSLSYPPLSYTDVIQKEKKTGFNGITPYIYAAIALLIVIALFIGLRKVKGHKRAGITNADNKQLIPNQYKKERIKKSAIYLFGGLQVFDSEGNDITGLFTPTIKYLFLLILFYTTKNDKGISSTKLTELLWFDKTENSAKNNRNVNISKLRSILEKIGDIEITHDNTYWKLNIGDGVFCDYTLAQHALKVVQVNDKEKGVERIYDIISLVEPGIINPDIQNEWIDPFKVRIADQVIDGLTYFSKGSNDTKLKLILCDTILKYDALNESAFHTKCRLLYERGKKTQAKHFYDVFCEEYFVLLNSKYPNPFNQIVS